MLALCICGDNVKNLVHTVIDKYAERGLRSLAVARQACLLLELHPFLDKRSIIFFKKKLCLIFYLVFLQQVPEKSKESLGEPWEFVGLLPLLDPPRSDSSDTIKRALDLGVNVKMITGTVRI